MYTLLFLFHNTSIAAVVHIFYGAYTTPIDHSPLPSPHTALPYTSRIVPHFTCTHTYHNASSSPADALDPPPLAHLGEPPAKTLLDVKRNRPELAAGVCLRSRTLCLTAIVKHGLDERRQEGNVTPY